MVSLLRQPVRNSKRRPARPERRRTCSASARSRRARRQAPAPARPPRPTAASRSPTRDRSRHRHRHRHHRRRQHLHPNRHPSRLLRRPLHPRLRLHLRLRRNLHPHPRRRRTRPAPAPAPGPAPAPARTGARTGNTTDGSNAAACRRRGAGRHAGADDDRRRSGRRPDEGGRPRSRHRRCAAARPTYSAHDRAWPTWRSRVPTPTATTSSCRSSTTSCAGSRAVADRRCAPAAAAVAGARATPSQAPLLLAAAAAALAAQPPPETPFLRLDTTMHTARVRKLVVDAPRNRLLTASDDKTVRLWQLPKGRLLRVFRVPIADGFEGRIYVADMHPRGRIVAAGGWTGWDFDGAGSIYLFDADSGELARRIGGFAETIGTLAFSPDGRHLAVGLLGSRRAARAAHHRLRRSGARPRLRRAHPRPRLRKRRPSGGGVARRLPAPVRRVVRARRAAQDEHRAAAAVDQVLARRRVDRRRLQRPRAAGDLSRARSDAGLERRCAGRARSASRCRTSSGTTPATRSTPPASRPGSARAASSLAPAAVAAPAETIEVDAQRPGSLWPLKGGRMAFASEDPMIGTVDANGKVEVIVRLRPRRLARTCRRVSPVRRCVDASSSTRATAPTPCVRLSLRQRSARRVDANDSALRGPRASTCPRSGSTSDRH